MSPIHSVKETTRILTELDPQEKDQLQESVLVTVATTLTKYRSGDKYLPRKNGQLAQGNNMQTDDSEDADESQDDSQYTEDEYGDDEEDSGEEEMLPSETNHSRGASSSHFDGKKTCCLCQCEECRASRARAREEEEEEENRRQRQKEKEAEAGKGTPMDKRVQVHSCQVQTSGAVTEYRPFVLHSPFSPGMEYMARSVVEVEEVKGQVIGDSLPSWLNGALIRIGPGKWDLKGPNFPSAGTFTLNNWFDGCAILTKYRIVNGEVYFSSRFLRSDAYQKMTDHGKPCFTEFGTRAYPDPEKGLFSRLINTLVPSDLTDNDISNIYQLSNEVYTATESCNIWKIDPQNLNSLRKINLDKLVRVSICSSHPHFSQSEGFMYNVGCTFMTGMKYHVIRMPVASEGNKVTATTGCCSGGDQSDRNFSRASIWTSFPSSHKTAFSYSHSFFITENYVIFVEQPLLVNGLKLATCTPKGKAMTDCLEWHPNLPVKFHLIDKHTGLVSRVKYTADAFFFFHTINAFEVSTSCNGGTEKCDRGYIVMDIVSYESPAILEKYSIEKMRNNEWSESCQPRAERYVLPLGNTSTFAANENLIHLQNCEASAVKVSDHHIQLKGEPLGPQGFELPRINYKHCNGKEYRYVYGTGAFEKGFYANAICKLDVTSKTVKLWRPETVTAYPGEAVFVPRPEAKDEDDGVLLSVVLEVDLESGRPHFLVALDARTMKEIARANFNQRGLQIPPSIHGIFIPSEESD